MAKFYPAGGGGSGGWDDVGDIPSDGMPVIVVAGAGVSAVNGNYFDNGYDPNTGKNSYYLIGDLAKSIMWMDGTWIISDGDYRYTSADDVATPDLCTTWTSYDVGYDPVPTVATGTDDYLDNYALVADGSGFAEWKKVIPYRSYVAMLNQDGTASAPTATVLENSLLGDAPTLSYSDVGIYAINHVTISGNSLCLINNVAFYGYVDGEENYVTEDRILQVVPDSQGITIYTKDTDFVAAEGFSNVSIEIRVY